MSKNVKSIFCIFFIFSANLVAGSTCDIIDYHYELASGSLEEFLVDSKNLNSIHVKLKSSPCKFGEFAGFTGLGRDTADAITAAVCLPKSVVIEDSHSLVCKYAGLSKSLETAKSGEWIKANDSIEVFNNCDLSKGENFAHCSGLIPPDTLMRDNKRQPLRCHYDSEAQLQTIPERVQRRGGSAGA